VVAPARRCEKHTVNHSSPKAHHAHHYHNGKYLYKTSEWTRLRESYAAQNPLCKHCQQYGIVTPGFIVDHIVEIADGGEKFAWSNLQHLCASCHNVKTGREKVRRRKKKENNGFGTLSDF
jgi:5-methylcytosine-specific restriction protein A